MIDPDQPLVLSLEFRGDGEDLAVAHALAAGERVEISGPRRIMMGYGAALLRRWADAIEAAMPPPPKKRRGTAAQGDAT